MNPETPSSSRSHPPQPAAAFTLLEMMLVVVIMGVLMGVAVFAVAGGSDSARVNATKGSIRVIETGLKAYYMEQGAYPASIAALVPKYVETPPKDAWKRELNYFTPGAAGRPYSLTSNGKDGELGTEDDIDSTRLDE